ncbi:MAG: ClC family H(+)/Cl(-) exchange transporter [Vicinamibacterales bacterium]
MALGLVSIAVGAWTGAVVASFRLGLAAADRWRDALLAVSHRWSGIGLVSAACACAGAAAAASWLARRFSPYAEGSGIPEVEVALLGELPPMPLPRLLLVKFVGGLLAIGGGLALGPEGPSVQMGAVGARLLGRRFGCGWPDVRALIAAGTGAGLAVAFNAPVAGAVFVLEELHRQFDRRQALAALGASSTAILVARLLLGEAPLFRVAASALAPVADAPASAAAAWPMYLALGVVAGICGAAYNRVLTGALEWAERTDRWPVRVQAPVVGALVGVIGWFAPHVIGAGETLTQGILAGVVVVGAVPLTFVLRVLLGAACYGVRAPGGLFAPLLLLGAQVGLVFGGVCHWAFPALGVHPHAFALIGMAAFFTGTVRTPVTGIVLVIEMTAAFTTIVPMLGATFAALLAADLTGIPPIYDSLRGRLRDRLRAQE